MRLEQEDLNAIGEIVVSRYFKKGGLKYTSLRDPRRIFKAYNDVDEQYKEYPQMSRDWYVSNSVDKDANIARTWKELKKLVDFLNDLSDKSLYNFVVRADNELALAKVETQRADSKEAGAIARRHGYKLFVFTVKVPSNLEYDVDVVNTQ
ncbi:MAG TPA: hypothetical protein VEG65_01820 [Candidatus Bathyarchaeia archaeon]|nr:hypothetical protein [Candidatus Bathyarchaeia archaeon]